MRSLCRRWSGCGRGDRRRSRSMPLAGIQRGARRTVTGWRRGCSAGRDAFVSCGSGTRARTGGTAAPRRPLHLAEHRVSQVCHHLRRRVRARSRRAGRAVQSANVPVGGRRDGLWEGPRHQERRPLELVRSHLEVAFRLVVLQMRHHVVAVKVDAVVLRQVCGRVLVPVLVQVRARRRGRRRWPRM